MSKEILLIIFEIILGSLCVSIIIYDCICLARLVMSFRKRPETITITPEDVDLIREALAVSRINHDKLYENNLFDFEKYTVDQIIALQKQLTTIANQSSAMIEVSK